MANNKISVLFLDIGGVLLTNGWDRDARHRAVEQFNLDEEEMNERHHLTFDTYEAGKLTLDEYLDRIVFYKERSFSRDDFKAFMFRQSDIIEGSIEFFKSLKDQYNLKVVAVNNEGRELNDFRIRKYNLNQLFDAYVSSCYVHMRKPDADIFRLACDTVQTPLSEILYVDDRPLFVEVTATLGIRGYHFQGIDDAREYMRTTNFTGE